MTRVFSAASRRRFHPPFHDEGCKQSLSGSRAAEGGLPAPLLPLHLPCPPCLDIEHPLLLTKEVWLPCLLSLELMRLPLPVTRFCLAICLHLLGCHMLGHPHSKRRTPSVHPGLSHSLFLPQTHGGAPSKICACHHRPWKASGGPHAVHTPRCLLVNRTVPVPHRAWRERAPHWISSDYFLYSWVFHARFLSS